MQRTGKLFFQRIHRFFFREFLLHLVYVTTNRPRATRHKTIVRMKEKIVLLLHCLQKRDASAWNKRRKAKLKVKEKIGVYFHFSFGGYIRHT